jgi:hypothetical protein
VHLPCVGVWERCAQGAGCFASCGSTARARSIASTMDMQRGRSAVRMVGSLSGALASCVGGVSVLSSLVGEVDAQAVVAFEGTNNTSSSSSSGQGFNSWSVEMRVIVFVCSAIVSVMHPSTAHAPQCRCVD